MWIFAIGKQNENDFFIGKVNINGSRTQQIVEKIKITVTDLGENV